MFTIAMYQKIWNEETIKQAEGLELQRTLPKYGYLYDILIYLPWQHIYAYTQNNQTDLYDENRGINHCRYHWINKWISQKLEGGQAKNLEKTATQGRHN